MEPRTFLKSVSSATLRGFNTRFCCLYPCDIGLGRCRLGPDLFHVLGIRMGWILRLSLQLVEGKSMEILCTAWPDTSKSLSNDCLILDDAVHNASVDWIECYCEVKEACAPRICHSIRFFASSSTGFGADNDSISPAYEGAAYTGLAVKHGFYVRQHEPLNRIIDVTIVGTSTGSLSIIGRHTVCIFEPASSDYLDSNAAHIHSPSATTSASAVTRVVDILVKRIIFPSISLSPSLALKGVLLYGPPGVGKTHSIKAVKMLYKNAVDVHIHEINIPDALAAEDPLRKVRLVLRRARRSMKKHTAQVPHTRVVSTSNSDSAISPTLSDSRLSTPPSSSSFSKTDVYRPEVGAGDKFSRKSPAAAAAAAARYDLSHRFEDGALAPAVLSSASLTGSNYTFSSPSLLSSSSSKERSPQHRQVSAVAERPEVSLIIIDEIDALGSPPSHSDVQAAIKAELCQWFDFHQADISIPCCIVGTSNRPGDVDPCLLRGGRMEREVEVYGSREDRVTLLCAMLEATASALGAAADSGVKKASSASKENIVALFSSLSSLDFLKAADMIADRTGGFVAADLRALVDAAVKGLNERSAGIYTDSADAIWTREKASEVLQRSLEASINCITPSALRGVAVKLPKFSFDDIIGYADVKKSLKQILAFADPLKSGQIARFGLSSPGGVILHGPPGNGKTRLVLAAASSVGLPLITLSAADVYSPFVGDAEAEIRKAFRIGRQAAPAVLFLDELDALVTNRGLDGGHSSASSNVESRVLATLLIEMDGIDSGKVEGCGVIVFAATNRLDSIDPALLRKGRFHHALLVPPPNEKDRCSLLTHFSAKYGMSEVERKAVGDVINNAVHAMSIAGIFPQLKPPVRRRMREGCSRRNTERLSQVSAAETSGGAPMMEKPSICGADIENFCREVVMRRIRTEIGHTSCGKD